MSSVLLFSEMKQSLFFIRFRMDLLRRVAGGVNRGETVILSKEPLDEDALRTAIDAWQGYTAV